MGRIPHFLQKCIQKAKIISEKERSSDFAEPETSTAASPVSPRLLNHSSSAAIWHEALKKLRENEPRKYGALKHVVDNVSTSEDVNLSKWLDMCEDKPESRALLQRLKAIFPSPGTIRALVMPFAGMDPHGIAPFVVTGSLFVIDVLLGRLGPEDQRKIRNMLFESVNAINECISFETNFLKGNDAVKQEVQELNARLPRLYGLALQLLCKLLIASHPSWLDSVGNKLSAAVVRWQEQTEQLKDHRASWTARRKVMDERLSRLDYIAVVLDFIRSPNDPERSLEALKDRVTSDGRHKDSASWILGNKAFQDWSQKFCTVEPSSSATSCAVFKPILWISGSYGVGKTTVVHRIVSELQRLAQAYPPSGIRREQGLMIKGLQVIPYFCNTTDRPNCKTIIRSIGQKLSFLPDFTISKAALKFYKDKTTGLKSQPSTKDYENLVRRLLEERSDSYNIALVFDALNECDPPQDAEGLFKFIEEIVERYPNVQVLFSSHEKISGMRQLEDHLQRVDVVSAAPEVELRDFVPVEIKFRQAQLRNSRSIFLNPEYQFLLDELWQSLAARAKGMYVWVQVWLDITLPLQDDSKTVRLEDEARKLLDALKSSSTVASEASEQLHAGYQQLWDLGALRGFQNIRLRLFRFLLCAFAPLHLRTITHALRIDVSDDIPTYRTEVSVEEIEKLCSNFLSKDEFGFLAWNHDAARNFVVREILNPGIDMADTGAHEASMKSNHLVVVDAFLAVMGDPDHQVWVELDLDPFQWMEPGQDNMLVINDVQEASTSLDYLGRYGWRHCRHAADKQAILDPLWTRVFRELIMKQRTAFALWWQVWFKDRRQSGWKTSNDILGNYIGKRVVLSSHVFASLDLGTDGILELLDAEATMISPEPRVAKDLTELLLHHAACSSFREANVLHLACELDNGDVAKLMLEVIFNRHGGLDRLSELFDQSFIGETPFIRACSHKAYDGTTVCSPDVMEILLRFENDHPRPMISGKSSARALTPCFWSQICSASGAGFEETALMRAIETGQQEDIVRLLKVHNPCDVDYQTQGFGRTALHCAASGGLVDLVKVLVSVCYATIDLRDSRGKSPLDAARDGLILCPIEPSWENAESLERNEALSKVIEYLEAQNVIRRGLLMVRKIFKVSN